ncbi:uncharacterized protein LOC141664715 [Apium graveolens]|uniref:uncharacterized protein LOC141664715 n=1 Tax=Apium graveolens TaxID=4045 RepID=UPI003D7980D9
MSCLSWNCRGLGNPRTVRGLNDLVRDRKPDVLFLSETISDAGRIKSLRMKLGFAQDFSVDRIGRSGGLAIFWKSHVDCSITGYSQNHIDIIFNENNVASWRLTFYYGYPERSRRREAWNMICRLAKISNIPWCIMGDFNDLLYSVDKKGNHPHPVALMKGFRNALEESLLTELELSGGSYTWEKSRGTDDWVQERLDRAFAMMQWWSKFPLCKLSVVSTSVSDHDLIQLDLLEFSIPKRAFRFKFENKWLKEPSFIKDVAGHWENISHSHLLPKLMSVSRYMEKWGRNFFNKFKEKVKHHKALMDSLKDNTDDYGVRQFLMERDKLNEILLHEEIY